MGFTIFFSLMTPITIIVLFLVGISAVITEMFIPGMIVGITGVILMITSIVMAYQGDYSVLGHVLTISSICSAPLLLLLWRKILSKTFSLKTAVNADSSSEMHLNDLIQKEGVAVTNLHPSGIIMVNGKRIDVVTSGEMIERNSRIRITEVSGNRVVVRCVKS